jgi:AraC family transcriptional regulator
MSAQTPLPIDFSQPAATATFLPRPPVLSSHRSGWENIYLAHYQLPAWEIPEIASPQHTIVLVTPKHSVDTKFVAEGRVRQLQFNASHQGYISILPAQLPNKSSWNDESEFTHCYLTPNFLARVAYESIDPDRVEIKLDIQTPDPLVWQICSTLKTLVATDATNSCLYAESMATALAAHLLQFYATRKHSLREYEDGLPQSKLKRAIEYINEHLGEDISLLKISTELDISHYYLCRLFKQSLGITPHAYLIQQRVERSKQLLKYREIRILDIAIACGFANPSHFARCFRRQVGISPKQFRLI